VACALVWTAQNAALLGGDPTRLVVAGDSAGGNLAVNLAYAAALGQAQSGCGGQWKLKDFTPGEGCQLGAFTPHFVMDTSWIDIAVPGAVYQALVAAGRLQDPFYDQNERACAWVRDREWWYRTTFVCEQAESLQADERLQLVFQGLDTFATIWLNGIKIGETRNMFREAVFDVTEYLLLNAPNTLALCFNPSLERVKEMTAPSWGIPLSNSAGPIANTKRTLMRKAQFGCGWDIGPDLPTVGIWRPVNVSRQRQALIGGVHSTTMYIDQQQDFAEVSVDVEIERFAGEGPLNLVVKMAAPGEADTAITVEQPISLKASEKGFVPLLEGWTCLPTFLYLRPRQQQQGASGDIRQRLEGGKHGSVFTRGPSPHNPYAREPVQGTRDIFSHRETQVQMAEMSMKGTYAYNFRNQLQPWSWIKHLIRLCDQLGILLWQDFMFADAPYPEDDPDFVNEVREEVRNHPSLALWCGNNEAQLMDMLLHSFAPDLPPLAGTLYYDDIMPRLIQEHDGYTPYWPGSPFGGGDDSLSSMREGDYHDWHVWHGLPLKKDNPKNKGDLLMSSVTGLPQNLEEYIDFSMIAQAEGLKFGIEHFRQRKPHCSGTLIWQLNDCWPGLSWSILDYYGFGKASYYTVSRAYAPVLASFQAHENGIIELWLTNDTRKEISDTVTVQYCSFDEGTIWEEQPSYLAGGRATCFGISRSLSPGLLPARTVSHQSALLYGHQRSRACTGCAGVDDDIVW
jgi:beta-mannosidase